MAKKLNYRDMEMDVMERLYHERKESRQKAYATKKKKKAILKEISLKRSQMKRTSDAIHQIPEQSICNLC